MQYSILLRFPDWYNDLITVQTNLHESKIVLHLVTPAVKQSYSNCLFLVPCKMWTNARSWKIWWTDWSRHHSSILSLRSCFIYYWGYDTCWWRETCNVPQIIDYYGGHILTISTSVSFLSLDYVTTKKRAEKSPFYSQACTR